MSAFIHIIAHYTTCRKL